jgi:hypothetical protein
LFADAPAGAGAVDLVEVHIVLVRQPAHERRDDAPLRRVRVVLPGCGLAALLGFLRRFRRGLLDRGALLLRGGGFACVVAGLALFGRGHGRVAGLVAGGFLGDLLRLLRRGLGRLLFRSAFARALAGLPHDGERSADVHGLAFGDEDLLDHSGCRRGHLGVDLVGRDLNEELVLCDRVAFLLEPFRDGSFDDGLAELRHLYLGRHQAEPSP